MGGIITFIIMIYICVKIIGAKKKLEINQTDVIGQKKASETQKTIYKSINNSTNTTGYVPKPRPMPKPTIDLTKAKPMQPSVANVPRKKEPQRIGTVGERRIIKDREGNELVVATRLIEGDRVPKGYNKQVCGYCGADNIVPLFKSEKYGCYFCHEKI